MPIGSNWEYLASRVAESSWRMTSKKSGPRRSVRAEQADDRTPGRRLNGRLNTNNPERLRTRLLGFGRREVPAPVNHRRVAQCARNSLDLLS